MRVKCSYCEAELKPKFKVDHEMVCPKRPKKGIKLEA